MTIDSNENVLITKTATGIATVGSELKATGELLATVNNDACAFLNRKSSDGDIINLRKDGTTVGSIGTTGSNVVIGTGSVGLRFYGGGDAVIPHTAAGGSSNGLVDLGQGGFNAFKDLYLSGGVYLGGTGSANKLDDYESGSFTANGNWVANNNKYIKVGDLVTISMDLTGPASGSHSQFNLPFTCNATTAVGVYTTFASFSGGRTYATAVAAGGVCYLRQNGSGVQFAALNVGAGQVLHFSLSYYTTS
jgi:hypothetical protein